MFQYGLHQHAVEGGQHVDVDILVVDDLPVLPGRVEGHVLFQGAGGRLDVEIAERDLDPLLLQQLLSELHDPADLQVDLAGALGIFVLAEGHPLGDHLAHALQRHDLTDCSALLVDLCHCHSSNR